MKKLLFLIIIFCALKASAQNYLITFAGTGASTTVNTVKVENLTAVTSLTINGSDILRLTIATGVNSIDDKQSSELKIYPNPMTDNSTLEIFPSVAGNAFISILDMTGKKVAQIQSYLENLKQSFKLSGLKNGFYLINVKGDSYQFSGKLLSNGKSNGTISIDKVNNIAHAVKEKTERADSKGVQATVDMAYTTGDRIKFTGISGIYSTVKTDIPASSKTITFNFIACTDGDNNNYPVVEIGTQVWMEENLKTTKYNDETSIPLVTDKTAWANLSIPGYCWYNNDATTNKIIYGALYNWYTVNTGKLCSTGWHVPTKDEWATPATYLGGESIAGGKLKETGTSHWLSPNTGANNTSGFTALPGGYRYTAGEFDFVGMNGFWWSANESNTDWAYDRELDNDNSYYWFFNDPKKAGFSVRCIKDN